MGGGEVAEDQQLTSIQELKDTSLGLEELNNKYNELVDRYNTLEGRLNEIENLVLNKEG